MKTEQAIRKLGQTLWDILGREYIDKYCEDKNGNLVSVSSISVEDIAEELVNAGYGDVSEYKAEIERLKAENKSQERENGFLKYCQCLTHGVDGSNHIKRAKIDVLNEVKERAVGLAAIETYHICNLIDELIKEVQNGEDKG